MMNGTSMQEMNDPNLFEYGDPNNLGGGLFQPAAYDDGGYENPNESGFDFNRPGTPNRRSNGYPRREMNQSPSKTAGMIQLKELASEDITNEPYNGRDAVVIIEGEMRQFDGKRQDKI